MKQTWTIITSYFDIQFPEFNIGQLTVETGLLVQL
nr:hypothetical protein GGBNIMDK_00151 [Bacillus cereus]